MQGGAPSWHAFVGAASAVVAAGVPGDTPLKAGAALPSGLALAGAVIAFTLAVGLMGLGRAYARGLGLRAARLEGRLHVSATAAEDLRGVAVGLAGGAVGERAAFEQACTSLADQARRSAALVRHWRLMIRAGGGLDLGRRIVGLEQAATGIEASLDTLAARVASVREELAATTAYLAGVAVAIDALCDHAATGGARRFWCEDVRLQLDASRRTLKAARVDLGAGRVLEALRAGRRLRGRLLDLRQILVARQASLAWLEAAPAEAARLAAAVTRLRRAGYRGLPDVPVGTIVEDARRAIADLQGGEPRRAAAAQASLRGRLEGLREATIAREERREANERRLAAARRGHARLLVALAAMPTAPVKRRYAAPCWASAQRLGDRLAAQARHVEMALRHAAQANHLDAQAFEEAAALLGQAETALAAAHEDAQRCQAAWRAPAQEESHAEQRLASLEAEVGAAYARARAFGLAPGPGIQDVLVAARQVLRSEPVDLAAERRLLLEAEAVLARFQAHLDRVAADPTARGAWRPGRVTITPPEAVRPADRSEWGQGR